jgi:DNA repair protein RadC
VSKRYRVPIYKVQLVRESGLWAMEQQVTSPRIAAAIARDYLEGTDREHFVVLLLDGRNRVIGINTVSVGALSTTLVHPREVFKPAILANSNSVILVHNHPSGDPTPSPDDIEMFARLKQAGDLLGVEVHDAIILGFDLHYSASSGCKFSLAAF